MIKKLTENEIRWGQTAMSLSTATLNWMESRSAGDKKEEDLWQKELATLMSEVLRAPDAHMYLLSILHMQVSFLKLFCQESGQPVQEVISRIGETMQLVAVEGYEDES